MREKPADSHRASAKFVGGDGVGSDLETDAALTERLRRQILSGALPPGTKLPEELLADSFGVTRARVRGILQRLTFDRLVEHRLNRGAFIASPTVKEARNIFEARRVIERVTTEIVTRTVQTWQLRALRRQVAQQQRALLAGDRDRAVLDAAAFHRRLSSLAHNAALTDALEPLILRTSLIVALYGTNRTMLRVAELHDGILDIVDRGESAAAAAAMERCLFAIEAELDLRPRASATIDLAALMRRVG